MIIQIHWQFKDHTELVSQKDIKDRKNDLQNFVRETREGNALPEGAIWMLCTENSKHFINILQGL